MREIRSGAQRSNAVAESAAPAMAPPTTPAARSPALAQDKSATQDKTLASDRLAAAEAEAAALAIVLRIERLARDASSLAELRHLAANETRKLNRSRQIFVIAFGEAGDPSVETVSGIAVPDPQSLLVDAVRRLVARLRAEHGLREPVEFTLPAYCDAGSELATSYPFRELAWVPFHDRRERLFGGLLMAREGIWTKDDCAISSRLASTLAHAWRELATADNFRPRRTVTKPLHLALIAAAAMLAVPVRMTALAPVEVVARQPMIVSSPIDAVIDRIDVDPGSIVAEGAVLIRLSDTALRNRFEIAQQEVAVAEAKAKQATILAFNDSKGRHDLGISQAELVLKKAELAFAAAMLERTVIRAARAGLAVYPDKSSLIGRPVATGERIMEIADPSDVEARIDLAVPDAIALKDDSTVKLFLDVDPLNPWPGRVVRADYRARPSDSDVLTFRTIAAIGTDGRPAPRIGLRGTAQVYGDLTPLGMFLFRRPISALRQWLGI